MAIELKDSKEEPSLSKIGWFDGTCYEYFSNFYEAPIFANGKEYKTNEHFFQAHKATIEEDFEKIRTAPSPGMAKRYGNQIELVPDWENIKDRIMFKALLLKFTQHPQLTFALLRTQGRYIEEGNNWGDKYWGVVDGEGKNMLGKLLMKVRDILSQDLGELHESED